MNNYNYISTLNTTPGTHVFACHSQAFPCRPLNASVNQATSPLVHFRILSCYWCPTSPVIHQEQLPWRPAIWILYQRHVVVRSWVVRLDSMSPIQPRGEGGLCGILAWWWWCHYLACSCAICHAPTPPILAPPRLWSSICIAFGTRSTHNYFNSGGGGICVDGNLLQLAK